MIYSISTAAHLLAAVALVGQSTATLNKPLISPPIPPLDSGLFKYLKSTPSTHDQWEWGWIPDVCYDTAVKEGVNPYDIEVFNVHYTDCPESWIFCRHHNSPMSQNDMIDVFGRLPVGTRQWVRTIIGLPGARHAYTYWGSGDSVFFGDAQHYPTLFVHEIGHTLDLNAVPGYSGRTFSNSTIWSDSFNKDLAISDSYAATNLVEDWAQETVIALFDKVVPNGIRSVEPNYKQIFNQYTTVQKYLPKEALIPGGTCNRRWQNPTIRCMGPAAPCGSPKARGLANRNKPDVTIKKVPVTPVVYDLKTACNVTLH